MCYYNNRLVRESKLLAQEYESDWEDYYDELYEQEMLEDEWESEFLLRLDED